MRQLSKIFTVLLLLLFIVPTTALAQAPDCDSEYTIQVGDWLSKIADQFYGNVLAFDVIVEANNASADDAFTDIENPDLIEPGWVLCIPASTGAAMADKGEEQMTDQTAMDSAAPEGLSPTALANATYTSEWTQDGTAPLVDGEYSEQAAPGSATMTTVMLTDNIAYGILGGQAAAAIILVTDPGGSGTFYDLAVVVNQNGTSTNVAVTNLGDRVKINALKIENDQIVIDMIQAGPNDPMCCPTQQVIKTFALQDGQLVETSSQVVEGEEASSDAGIVGVIWNWVNFKDQAGQNDITVINPDNYRIWFNDDGTFNAKADCNMLSGAYTLEGNSLTLQPGPMTMAECGDTSQSNEYVALLGQVASYVRQGDNLALNLMADAGNMNFTKLHAVTGRVVAPEGSTVPEGATIEVRVDDVSLADAPATQVGGQSQTFSQFPVDFEAPYNSAVIEERNTYGLSVRVTDKDGNLLYINTQAYNVLTQGNPTYNVEVMVEPVGTPQTGPPQPDGGVQLELVGPSWRWDQTLMNNDDTIVSDNPNNYNVQFMADGTVSIQADCNQVGGTYTVDGSTISIQTGPTTLALCPPGSLGDQFVAQLTEAAIYFIEGENLFLDLKLDSGTMQFTPESTELADTSWIVTRYNNGNQGVVSMIIDTEMTANFGTDGQLTGSAGCNDYFADYTVDGDNITMGPVGATQKLCNEPEGIMEQEQLYLAALQTAATYSIRGGTLDFRTAEGARAAAFEPAR